MSRLPYANKNLGQHFLRDQGVIKKITQDFADSCQGIIEVGPGPGILSVELAKIKKNYLVIEKDTRFNEHLTPHLSAENIFFTDALKIDYQNFCDNNFPGMKDIWLVSNLPYNISVPLLLRFLQAPSIKFMTLMMQKEVAEKIFAPHSKKGNKNKGSLMFLAENYFEVSTLCQVPPGAFVPPPKVQSSVLSFTRRPSPLVSLEDFPSFEDFLRKLFSQRRKTLQNVFKSFFPAVNAGDLMAFLGTIGKSNSDRAETLDFEEIHKLFSFTTK